MQFGVFTVGDVTTDPTTGRTPSEAERIKAVLAIAQKDRIPATHLSLGDRVELHEIGVSLGRADHDRDREHRIGHGQHGRRSARGSRNGGRVFGSGVAQPSRVSPPRSCSPSGSSRLSIVRIVSP